MCRQRQRENGAHTYTHTHNMGERRVLPVSGRHGGNLWMMVSPTVTKEDKCFRSAVSLSFSRCSLSVSCPRFRPRTHTHTTRSLSHTPHAAGSGSMATCDTGTSLCRHRHIISRYTRVLVWSSAVLCCEDDNAKTTSHNLSLSLSLSVESVGVSWRAVHKHTERTHSTHLEP